MKQTKKVIAAGFAAIVMSLGPVGSALAASISANDSFENGTNPGVFTTIEAGDSTSIHNWTVVSGNVDYVGTYWEASEGNRSLDMTGTTAGAIRQNLSTVAGHTYQVTFDLAANPDGGSVIKTLAVDAGGTPELYTANRTGKTRNDMGWTLKTFKFTATGTSTALTFTSMDTAGFWGPTLDNVAVTDVLTNKEQCKNNGWKAYMNPAFNNQGDCVSYISSNPKATGNRAL